MPGFVFIPLWKQEKEQKKAQPESSRVFIIDGNGLEGKAREARRQHMPREHNDCPCENATVNFSAKLICTSNF